ncbi:MAG: hypothetical protein AABY22_33760, partial [Nanoarchaeota archaeon]
MKNKVYIKLNELPKCPKCKCSWDGENIFDVLRASVSYKHLSDEGLTTEIKSCYGSSIQFRRTIHTDDYGTGYFTEIKTIECPDCHTLWNERTGEIIKKQN